MQETHWERVQRSIGGDRPSLRRRIERVRELGFPDLELILQETWADIAREAKRCSSPAVGIVSSQGVAHYTPRFSAAIYEWMMAMMRDRPLSYVQLLCMPEMHEFIQSFSRNSGMVPGALSFSMVLTYFMAAYELHGKRTYTVSPGLAEQLIHTELRGLSCEDLRLPFPAIYIEVPARADLRVWNNETGWHRLEGVYVIEDPDILGGSAGMDFLEAERAAWELEPGQLLRGWRLLLVGECKDPDNSELMGDDAVYYYRVPLPEKKSVEEVIERARDHAYRGRVAEKEKADRLDPGDEWKRVFSWVMNLMMYTTWVEPNAERWMLNKEARQLWERIQKIPKGSPKRKRLHGEFQKLDPRWRYPMGQHILVQRGEEREVGALGEKRGPVTVISWVAGHWRRVAHGPGRTLRTWKHIEPYRRGPEGAPEIWKPHRVE